LLERIANLTGNVSLKSNIALIKNNAMIGARLAVELYSQTAIVSRITVMGGTAFDLSFVGKNDFVNGESNVGKTTLSSPGGVARNIQENLARILKNGKMELQFISIVGNDLYGEEILTHLKHQNVDVSQVQVSADHPTASYCAFLNPDGNLIGGFFFCLFLFFAPFSISKYVLFYPAFASMEILEKFDSNGANTQSSDVLILDCNFSEKTIFEAVQKHRSGHIWIDPTSGKIQFYYFYFFLFFVRG
jgi:hypothetical protein